MTNFESLTLGTPLPPVNPDDIKSLGPNPADDRLGS